MLLFNSLPTDLEDKAYSNLTIPSILGYSGFVTSSHYLPPQTLFFGAWVSLHKNPCLRRQLLWEKTTRCTWKTYDSRPLLLIRVDDGSTVEFRGTKMFSLWRRDHSAMPINHQLRQGNKPFWCFAVAHKTCEQTRSGSFLNPKHHMAFQMEKLPLQYSPVVIRRIQNYILNSHWYQVRRYMNDNGSR